MKRGDRALPGVSISDVLGSRSLGRNAKIEEASEIAKVMEP
ncbi:hypothetical protein [Lusitaniella coriacea]|nr:hypothetical protein [Lusitaniella coriacea]